MKILSHLTALLILILQLSCSKNNTGGNNPPQKSCRVSKVITRSGTSVTTYNFTYDEHKRLTLTARSDNNGAFGRKVITYTPNAPYHIETFSGNNPVWLNYRDVSTYSDGTMKHVVAVNNVPNAFPITVDYNHDGSGRLWGVTNINKTDITTMIYKWDNAGNMIHIYEIDIITEQPKGDTSFYEYYLDKTYDPPNVDQLSKSMSHYYGGLGYILDFGAPIYYTKNLLKREYSKLGSRTYTYEFDTEGRIVKANILGDTGSTSSISFEYTCD